MKAAGRFFLVIVAGVIIGFDGFFIAADALIVRDNLNYVLLPPTALERCAATYTRIDPRMGRLILDMAKEEETDSVPPPGFPDDLIRYRCSRLAAHINQAVRRGISSGRKSARAR